MGNQPNSTRQIPATCGSACDLCAWVEDFAASQVRLDPVAERALRDNLWDLYDRDDVQVSTLARASRARELARLQEAVFCD